MVISFHPSCFQFTKPSTISYPLEVQQFLKKNFLEIRMAECGHSLQWIENEPAILFEGSLTRWSDFTKFVNPNEKLYPNYTYTGDLGITKHDSAAWNKLRPLWTDQIDPRPGHFFVEIVVKSSSKYCHTYLNLIDRNCRVSQIGLSAKMRGFFSLSVQKGKLFHPDIISNRDGIEDRARFKISEEEYEKLRNMVEEDQKTENHLFSGVTRNCSTYSVELLREVGIDIRHREYPFEFLARTVCEFSHTRPPEWVLKVISFIDRILRYLLSPLFASIFLLMGAKYRQKKARDCEALNSHAWRKPFERPMQSFSSFVNRDLHGQSSWKIREYIRWLNASRELTYEQILQEFEYRQKNGLLTLEEEQMLEGILLKTLYGKSGINDPDTPILRPKPDLIIPREKL